MKTLITILIGLLVVGCGKKSSKPETKAKSPSTSPARSGGDAAHQWLGESGAALFNFINGILGFPDPADVNAEHQ